MIKQKIKDLYLKAGVDAIPCFDCGMDSDCSRCKFQDNLEFPPFTAEKQIALLQFLLEKFQDFSAIKFFYTGQFKMGVLQEWGDYKYEGEFTKTLEEALASVVLTVWDTLGSDERKKLHTLLATVDKEDMRWPI